MINVNLLHKLSDISIKGWLDELPNDLLRDAVGLWEIVRAGSYGFGLEDGPLTEFVGLCIVRLLGAGAIPLLGNSAPQGWIATKQYGDDSLSVAVAVISEWHKKQSDPTPDDSVWFGRPDLLESEILR
jgi:hypothetical protein